MEKPEKRRPLFIDIDEATKVKLKALAAADQRSMASLMRKLLADATARAE